MDARQYVEELREREDCKTITQWAKHEILEHFKALEEGDIKKANYHYVEELLYLIEYKEDDWKEVESIASRYII